MTIRYIDPGLSSNSNMIRIDDDDDIANMMEGSSPIAMYVSNKPIESDCTEYRPPIMPDIGPSDCGEYRPTTMPDNGPSSCTSPPEQVGDSEYAAGIGVQGENESQIERHFDIDPIESPLRINRYEAREKPLIKLLEYLRVKLMGEFSKKMAMSLEWSDVLTTKALKVSGLPCSYAITAIDHRHEDVTEFCGIYFIVQIYRRAYYLSFNPIPDALELPEIEYTTVMPPAARRIVGRPKK
ncbi:hypothetical protein AMTR_s00026p00171440 [Amborella trichopoda]|uniref:Uncharacterized protein n=1 Tax=Amborella trichopoda TaxID=13333 RepID=W1PRE8_AMBTC|nr:hypothetical protein AMTR_s00026p00171440 [Amborella trichopoda]